ncbi:MAG TPA: alpha/beta hydrolase [Anaerolineales bacterium]|nr:alpha/beta hydrolase [Anaerolineales bacterium]
MPITSNNGVKIYYEIEGKGPPVIFQTGAAGDMNMWREAGYIENLDGFRKILVDHRGHGRSDKPAALAQHRMENYVDDVLAVMGALGIERSAFIGYSDGGRVGFELAASHPDRIACLVSIGSVGLMNDEVYEARKSLADSIRAIGMQYLIDLYENDGDLFPEWLRGQSLSTDKEMIALELTGWKDWPGVWDRLAEIKVPVMIIVGEKEDPEDLAGKAEKLLQNGRRLTFPNHDHIGNFLALENFLSDLVEFISTNTP